MFPIFIGGFFLLVFGVLYAFHRIGQKHDAPFNAELAREKELAISGVRITGTVTAWRGHNSNRGEGISGYVLKVSYEYGGVHHSREIHNWADDRLVYQIKPGAVVPLVMDAGNPAEVVLDTSRITLQIPTGYEHG